MLSPIKFMARRSLLAHKAMGKNLSLTYGTALEIGYSLPITCKLKDRMQAVLDMTRKAYWEKFLLELISIHLITKGQTCLRAEGDVEMM